MISASNLPSAVTSLDPIPRNVISHDLNRGDPRFVYSSARIKVKWLTESISASIFEPSIITSLRHFVCKCVPFSSLHPHLYIHHSRWAVVLPSSSRYAVRVDRSLLCSLPRCYPGRVPKIVVFFTWMNFLEDRCHHKTKQASHFPRNSFLFHKSLFSHATRRASILHARAQLLLTINVTRSGKSRVLE